MATATTNNHNQLQRRLTKTTQPARPHAISPASGKLDVAQKNECMQLARMMNHDQLPVMCQEYVSSMTQTKRSFDGASHKEVFCFCALLRPPFSDSFSFFRRLLVVRPRAGDAPESRATAATYDPALGVEFQ